MNIKLKITGRKTTLLLFVVAFAFSETNILAQGINEQVTVVGAFEPVIPESNKINISPSTSETEVKLPEMTYSVKSVQMETTLNPDDITPVKLVGEPLKKLYRNYARVGLGNYMTPYAEFFANSLRSKEYAFGVHLKHLSSAGAIKDYPKSSNSLNLIGLNGQKYFDNHTVSAQAGYRRNVVHHYGIDSSELNEIIDEDNIRQRFNRINLSADVKSNYSDADHLNHKVGLSFKNIGDLFETRESLILFETQLDKRFELFDLTDYQVLGLDASLGFTGYKDSTLKQKSTLIIIKPHISTEFEQYKLLFGLNFSVQVDSASKIYLYPYAEAQVRTLEDALVITAGITGGITRKGFDQLSEINPFVQSVLPLQYTRELFTFYAGARARAGKQINLAVSFNASSIYNEPFFVNDETLPYLNRFMIVYNEGELLQGRIDGEFHSSDKIRVKAFASFEKWSLANNDKAWHRPASSFGIQAFYDIQRKIIVKAGFTSNGKQYARIPDKETEGNYLTKTIKGYTDINLGVEYRYTKVLSGFLNISNLMGTRYYMWYNYPNYRFQIMGGVTYSF